MSKTALHLSDGRIAEACWLPSPNFGPRPQETSISLLVIHNISLPPAEFGGGHIEAFFQNRLEIHQHPYFSTIADLKVSSHLLIERCGRLVQFVNLNDRAWHAGQSSFAGRDNCNDFSIGIELEGTDDIPYTQAQYQQLSAVSQLLMTAYPEITMDTITGHQDIAPGRKTDPGPSFDWQAYREAIKLKGQK